ncbi:MAG: hypothetical protein GTN89_01245 [Acidobacteria bacterium]|nr:hypothetical protein [Acidobacteriota bacterium]NIM60942.1 hypothetical protein [Acidobacteriota bacterium]NIO58010.1 hypothetical protein [Acidobacteriota bacterium]NIQ29017.1 hypothetical protein [Acidobacteriota bacterium]NIQ83541.1 hypothetical protein [Acidobacteriota bacterium]
MGNARSFRIRIAGLLVTTLSSTGFASPALPSAETELSSGVFLVASRDLLDPRFRKTVILLTRHSELGAVGLIINRRTEMPLAKLLQDEPSLADVSDRVFIGGPVDAHSVQFLIRADSRPDGSLPVLDEVYISSSAELLERLTRDGTDGGKTLRVFVGYSGWAPGQLENEISRGGWHVMPADATSIFERDPKDVWSALMRRISPAHGLEARLSAPYAPGSPARVWPADSSAWASSPRTRSRSPHPRSTPRACRCRE